MSLTKSAREHLSPAASAQAYHGALDQFGQHLQRFAERRTGRGPDRLLRSVVWDQEPHGITDWLDDPDCCDVSAHIYPGVRRTLEAVFSGDPLEPGLGTGESPNGGRITEVTLCWGIGSGKSFLTALAIQYILHRLGCMRDPATALGLAPRSEVVIANVSVNEDQAKNVIFSDVMERIRGSKWFEHNFLPQPGVRSELRFPKRVRVFPGNSTSKKVLGLNVIASVIDEAAFHAEVKDSARAYANPENPDNFSGATELYAALQARGQSRFGDKYLMFLVSSPLFMGDFIQTKLQEFAQGAKGMLAGHAAQWEIKPVSAYPSGESFFIDPLTKRIYDRIPEDFTGEVKRWER